MKLIDREKVDGTEITIGRRVYSRDGQQIESDVFAAEYRNEDGEQVCEGLGTKSRLEARRKAVAIFNRLADERPREKQIRITVAELTDLYMTFAKAKGIAPKSEAKYETDLEKLKEFCKATERTQAIRFGRDDVYAFREWLVKQGYAAKTIYGVLIVAKQVFKWGNDEGKIPAYTLGSAKVAKAKARSQPCFTTAEVELILGATTGMEQAVFATLAYAGLRVGEAEQLQWGDVKFENGSLGMFHICRGGWDDKPKDKEDRFVPILGCDRCSKQCRGRATSCSPASPNANCSSG
jgi:hypothetical protein